MHKFMKYCPNHYKEIENYELALADNFKGWICHHRNGEQFDRDWLIKNHMYYHREDPHEFKFVTCAEHLEIHGVKGGFEGHHHTEEAKAIIIKNLKAPPKGRIPWNKGMKTSPKHSYVPKWRLSDETKARMAEARRQYWERRRQNEAANMEESK